MNILIICNKFPYPLTDGGIIGTFTTIRGMYEAGHNLTVAAINTPKHFCKVEDLPDYVKKMADFRTVFVNTDLTKKDALCNLLFSRLPYTATRFITKNFSDLLQNILQEKTFDIIQLEGLYMCAYIPTIRKYSKAKIAYRANNVEYEIWQRLASETSCGPKQFYLKNLARRVKRFEISTLNTYDFLATVTLRDKEILDSLGNNKPSFVAPTGIFVEDLHHNENQQCELALFHIGALDWMPNQQGIIWFIENCWSALRSKFPDLKLYIAGRNASQSFLDQISNKEGVIYVGEVPDAHEFMSKYAIMIVPLLAGGGMRVKIIEGLSLGKVIVSTSIGTEGIAAKDGEEIFIANTPDNFISAISLILNKTDLIQTVGKNAENFVSLNFDNTNIIKRKLDFYAKN